MSFDKMTERLYDALLGNPKYRNGLKLHKWFKRCCHLSDGLLMSNFFLEVEYFWGGSTANGAIR